MKRQQRKLNFLITQTELYAHFMSRKLTGASTADRDRILNRLQEGSSKRQLEVKDGVLEDIAMDDYGEFPALMLLTFFILTLNHLTVDIH